MNELYKIAIPIFMATVLIVVFLIFYKGSDRPEIIRFTKRLTVFATPITILLLLIVGGYKLNTDQLNGISMAQQIETSFGQVLNKKYNTIIMGNSRTYRGINPAKMDTLTYNFSFDNETFFEQYYKLLYLESHNSLPKTLILGVDYFEFSFLSGAMQTSYQKFFEPQYIKSYNNYAKDNTIKFQKETKADDYINTRINGYFGRGASMYLNHIWRIKILRQSPQSSYLKTNGQYIINPVPTSSEGTFMTRESNKIDIQVEAFENIIAMCKRLNIKLVILMPPCRDIELACYSHKTKQTFNTYFESFTIKNKIYYINLSNTGRYTYNDYMDQTHLTPIAADKFSTQLQGVINKL